VVVVVVVAGEADEPKSGVEYENESKLSSIDEHG
jgi:hypothetical protein